MIDLFLTLSELSNSMADVETAEFAAIYRQYVDRVFCHYK